MNNRARRSVIQRLAFLTAMLYIVLWTAADAQQRKQIETDEGCTSIQVARLASTDGSVMVGHTCDGNYRTWLNIVPHAKHEKGATRKIYWGNLHKKCHKRNGTHHRRGIPG